jgi:hypothetical protein
MQIWQLCVVAYRATPPSRAYRDNDQIYIAGYCICHDLVACSTKLRLEKDT